MQKPVVYADIPEFDQQTQCVRQQAPVDAGNHIFVGVELHDVEPGGDLGWDDEPFFN